MRIEVQKETTYIARAGANTITGLRLVSSWEGMRKLQNDAGETLIVDGNTLVKASPMIIGALTAPDGSDFEAWRDRELERAEAEIARAGDSFITVPATKLPNDTIVPEFQVGQYVAGKTRAGQLQISATAEPWVDINYRDAREICQAAGYQLINEKQWLAMAWNVARVDANWTGGKVGDGALFQGLRKGTVSKAQPVISEAYEDDEHRGLELSNGQRIWDINGNVFQWVFDDVQGNAEGVIAKAFSSDSLSLQAPYPSGEKGMGWRPSAGRDWSGDALIRGGYWNSGSNAGVFRLDRGWPGGANADVGFRCTKPGL